MALESISTNVIPLQLQQQGPQPQPQQAQQQPQVPQQINKPFRLPPIPSNIME
jgi:hypothetical protein